MKSIRLSLILYFLLLLAVALGGVSWLSYESTAQALLDKEVSTKKLWEAKFRQDCKEAHESFDRDLAGEPITYLPGNRLLYRVETDETIVIDGQGVVGLELKRAATHVCRVNDSGLEAKILRDTQATEILIATRVIDGVHVCPAQAGIVQRSGSTGRFDLEGAYAWSDP